MASSDEEKDLNKPLIDYGFEPVSRPENFYEQTEDFFEEHILNVN